MARWASFHVFVPDDWDGLLCECVGPFAREAQTGGLVQRWFFIRYGEPDLHVRIRFRTPDPLLGDLGHAFIKTVDAFAHARWGSAQCARVESHPYDREALYFGETMLSVYAELLNGATSTIALHILGGRSSGRASMFVATAAVLLSLVQAMAQDSDLTTGLLRESHDFAVAAVRERGLDTPAVRPSPPNLLKAVRRVADRLQQPGPGRHMLHDAEHLLCRARRRGAAGALVATHALHLLCNKVGLTLIDEALLLRALLPETPSVTPAGNSPLRGTAPTRPAGAEHAL